jgi:endonuclease/exonuclease/phosphatase family metal-dependent hydrolase
MLFGVGSVAATWWLGRQVVSRGESLLAALLLALLQPASAEPFIILSQNMNRLFDDIDDGNGEKVLSKSEFLRRVSQAARKFSEDYSMPQIIALQEVENLNVLQQIATQIREQHEIDYQLVLLPGQDPSGINLGFMVQSGIVIRTRQQLFSKRKLPFDGSHLFTRPPLHLEVCYQARCMALLNLHLRSMRGIDRPDKGERVVRKRLRQAEMIAVWINRYQQIEADTALLVLGDFNALTPADQRVDVAGIIRGSPDNTRARLMSRDLVDPDLIDLTRQIPAPERYSYIFRQNRQQLDYMFASQSLARRLDGISFGPIDYSFSDHAGLLAWYQW